MGYRGATSYVARSPQGLRGKRSADADAAYALAAYPYAFAPAVYRPYGYYGLTGVAGHPTGTSYVARSPQGLKGKRSADAEPEADAYYGGYYRGYYGRGYGYRGYGYGGYGYGRGYYWG